MVNNYYLKYFIDAVDLNSLTKAARKNLVSVSAVSQAIVQLERQFELDLISHKRNSFELTAHGKNFYEKSKQLLSEVDYFNSQIRMSKNEMIGRVEFATQQSFASIILPDILIRLQKKFPHMQPFFKMGITSEVRKWVSEGDIDFGVALGKVKVTNSKMYKVHEGSFVLLKKKGVKKSLKFLVTGEFKEVEKFKRDYKKFYKKELPVEMYIESWGVMTKMALKGLGIALVPDYFLKSLDKNNYSIARLPFELPKYEINVYKHKEKKISPQGFLFFEEFVDEVKSYF